MESMKPLVILGVLVGYAILFYFPSRSMAKKSPALGFLWFLIGLVVAYYVFDNYSDMAYTIPEVDI